MKCYYDLHIHTALSPCGDRAMTPNNIINMAILKGLDIIAITDHNNTVNCKPCIEVAQDKDIIVIPGMELQTKEEVHLICLFKNLNTTEDFQKIINSKIANKYNRPDFFGRQLIFDVYDNIIGEDNRLLMTSINISINEAIKLVTEFEGIVIPAHIDKKAFSIISNLGFIPQDLDITSVEISKGTDFDKFLSSHKYLNKYNIIFNSDAHYLGKISERSNYFNLKEKRIKDLFDYFLIGRKS